MKRYAIALLGGLWIVAAVGIVGAAEAQAPSDNVTVVSVIGAAEKATVSPDGTVNWSPLKAGESLGEKTLIRTGLRAKVVLNFADCGEVVITGAAKVGIDQFRKTRNVSQARIGLKYGTLRTTVEKRNGPQNWKVATPVATLSVRGSRSRFSCLPDNPGGLKVQVAQGNWNVGAPGANQNAGPGESTDNQGTPNNQVQVLGRGPHMSAWGLTPGEQWNLLNNGGGRGIFGPAGNNSGTNLFTHPRGSSGECRNEGEGEYELAQ